MRHRWEPYLWILPSILLMLVFVVFPIGIVFRLAFSHISRAGVVGEFSGLGIHITARRAEETAFQVHDGLDDGISGQGAFGQIQCEGAKELPVLGNFVVAKNGIIGQVAVIVQVNNGCIVTFAYFFFRSAA